MCLQSLMKFHPYIFKLLKKDQNAVVSMHQQNLFLKKYKGPHNPYFVNNTVASSFYLSLNAFLFRFRFVFVVFRFLSFPRTFQLKTRFTFHQSYDFK